MELIDHLMLGFGTALGWKNLVFCFVGALLGTLIGVLPGVGPLVTIAMLLPFTYTLGPTTAMIMLAGIFYGAQYGGSTTAILMRMPGEATSIMTSLDGYQMARQGKGGTALAVAAIGSFIAGTLATLVIAVLGPSLGRLAIAFGPPEYFALMVLGILSCLLFTGSSPVNGVAAILLGIGLAVIGVDQTTGALRYTFGLPELTDGIGFVPLAIGMFGLLEVAKTLTDPEPMEPVTEEIGGLMLNQEEWKRSLPAILRGTVIGTVLGVLPGGGLITSPFASYIVEKKLAKDPSRFGRGAIEGVAGPESANNAAAQTSFIPLLSLGIPSNAVMALMIGALMVQGITPGPTTFSSKPDLFWGLIASMWIGNLMLVILNLPLVGMWAKLARMPYRWLLPIIVLCSAVGAYSVSNATFDVYATAVFGVLGYLLWKIRCDATPLVMAYVLGGPLEQNLRASLSIAGGSPTVFVSRPISAVLLGLAVLLLLAPLFKLFVRKRDSASQAHVCQAREVKAVVSRPGSASLSVREVDTPQMGPHDVMIEVAAAGVTVADILLRKGLYPIGESETAIPGLEVAGVVRRIGREVTSWRPGDPVCSIVSGGGYAELAIVPAEHCLPVPSHWSMTDAASAVGPICTAWFNVAMLGRLAVCESLLVHGGSGGVGSWAVQIFGARGHPVYATAGGAARCEQIEALGATRCFDHQAGAFDKALFATTENQGVDVVLDILGAQALEANLRVLKEGGRLVGIATQQGAKASVDLWTLYRRRLSLTGSALRAQTRCTKKEIVAAVLANVWPVILQRRIASVVDSVYPFDRALEAQDRLERGGNFGKVVLQIKECSTLCGLMDVVIAERWSFRRISQSSVSWSATA